MSHLYSSAEFESKYTYSGHDLGATWSADHTAFRLWAPTADAAQVNLYRTGDALVSDRIADVPMKRSENGTWLAVIPGNLNGVYYTYMIRIGKEIIEACDPYAKTCGVNGDRAMVIDMASTNPEGWEDDKDPNAGIDFTDTVIYELHVRDLSIHPSSGIKNKGKYLGVIETGTKSPSGIPTGLDHIKSLGITHLHLLPVYDFGSVDERHPEKPQFNWGPVKQLIVYGV